jgi:hypothetical protein
MVSPVVRLTLSQAARSYSWMIPPRTSWRTTFPSTTGGDRPRRLVDKRANYTVQPTQHPKSSGTFGEVERRHTIEG